MSSRLATSEPLIQELAVRRDRGRIRDDAIVTAVVPLVTFNPAESEHGGVR